MFRKPIRTYERKRGDGRVGRHPSSETSMIVREDAPPAAGKEEATCSTIFLDDDTDYDPFDTTFDRLAREAQSRPQVIPPDRSSVSSYSSGSDSSLRDNEKKSLDVDPSIDLYASLEVVEQSPRKPRNKRRRLDSEPTTTTTTTTTTTMGKITKQRGTERGRGARTFKDENAEPNVEPARGDNLDKKKSGRKREEKKVPEETSSTRASGKRKGRANPPVVKRCSVNLERVSLESPGDSLVESKADESRKSTTDEPSGASRLASGRHTDQGKNSLKNPVVALSRLAASRRVDHRENTLKNPVVALSRLNVAKPPSDFSSSTPIVASRYTRDESALRLSPIKNDAHREDDSGKRNSGTASSSIKSSAGGISANLESYSSTGKRNTEGKKVEEKMAKCCVRILSVTPDTQASELLFDDTENLGRGPRSVQESLNGQDSPNIQNSPNFQESRSFSGSQEAPGSTEAATVSATGLATESSDRESIHLTYADDDENSETRHASEVSAPVDEHPTNAEHSTSDPFMGFSDRQADPSSSQHSSRVQSQSTDDEWSTISESLEIGGGITEVTANFEPLTSRENDSRAEPDVSVRAVETPDDQSKSRQDEKNNDLQPVVLLDRLTFGKVGKIDTVPRLVDGTLGGVLRAVPEVITVNDESSSRNINEESSSRYINEESFSRNINEESSSRNINEESFSRDINEESFSKDMNEESSSRNINEESSWRYTHEESSLKTMNQESFDDFDATGAGTESVRMDDSSENVTGVEESSTGKIIPDENGNETGEEFIDRELTTGTSADQVAERVPRSAKSTGEFESPSDEAPVEKSGPTEDHENDTSREREASRQPVVLLTRLNDPFRITRRRDRYRNWDLKLSAISESNNGKVLNPLAEDTEETARPATLDGAMEKPEVIAEYSKNERSTDNSQISGEIAATQPLHDKSSAATSVEMNRCNETVREDKVVFLKPGKSWARSLSILSQVHSQGDLEFSAAGKGRKWRESVRSLLGMQQQGHLQSCVRKNEDYNELSLSSGVRNSLVWIPGSSQPDTSRLFGIGSPARFIRRVSIRVLPDRKSYREVKDTSFLEAYGISPVETKETEAQRCTLLAPEKCLDILQSPVSKVKYRDVVLAQCGQETASPFEKCYPEEYLENCRKIGEGVYGEVFLYEKESERSVIKIIPIEGETRINGERQKKFDEILSEIVIAKELHNLRSGSASSTSSFVEVKNVRCVVGKYPRKLIDLWRIFDEEKSSENDCPSIFEEDQLYIALELGHGGEDLEAYVFQNASEAHALFMQAAVALAVAEETLEFEHRDLHWGNLLISRTDEPQIEFRLNDKPISLTTRGVKVSVIDFTLSRMSYEGCSIFNDLAMDEDLFVAQGEYQFDIYRLMRKKLENDWQRFEPYTNVLWLHYLLDKMIKAVRYRRKNTKVHNSGIAKLQELKDEILEYKSAADFVTSCDKATRPRASRTSVANLASST